MAGTRSFVPVDTDFPIHPKTKRARRALGLTVPETVGHLVMAWTWVRKFYPDGDLSACGDDEIADAAGWEGDAAEFVAALVRVGFLDRDGDGTRVHDWGEFAGKAEAERARNRAANREYRERRRSGASREDRADAEAPSRDDHVIVTRASPDDRVMGNGDETAHHVMVQKEREKKKEKQKSEEEAEREGERRAAPNPPDSPPPKKPSSRRSENATDETGAPGPWAVFEAVCDEQGVDAAEMPAAFKARQLAAAKRLIAAGLGPHEARQITGWLRSQSWVTDVVDMHLIEKQFGRWQMAGRPEEAPARGNGFRAGVAKTQDAFLSIARGEQ